MKDTNHVGIINQRIIKAIEIRKYEQAITLGEECIRTNGNNTPGFIYFNLGKAYSATGADDKAEKAFLRASNFHTHNKRKNPISRRAANGLWVLRQIAQLAAVEDYAPEQVEGITVARTGLVSAYDYAYPGLRQGIAGRISAKTDSAKKISTLRRQVCAL